MSQGMRPWPSHFYHDSRLRDGCYAKSLTFRNSYFTGTILGRVLLVVTQDKRLNNYDEQFSSIKSLT